MGRIVRMTAAEIDRELTPEMVKTMVRKAKTHPVADDEIPFSHEEWWEKAERPNRGRPKKVQPKEVINLSFEHKDLVYLRSTGRGWQTRVREYVEKGIAAGLL